MTEFCNNLKSVFPVTFPGNKFLYQFLFAIFCAIFQQGFFVSFFIHDILCQFQGSVFCANFLFKLFVSFFYFILKMVQNHINKAASYQWQPVKQTTHIEKN